MIWNRKPRNTYVRRLSRHVHSQRALLALVRFDLEMAGRTPEESIAAALEIVDDMQREIKQFEKDERE